MKTNHIRTFIYFIVCIPFFSHAQTKENTLYPHADSLELELHEKTIVDKAYALMNNSKTEESYKITHRLITTLKTSRSKSSLCLLLANYHLRHGLIDSTAYYTNKALKYNEHINKSLTREQHLSLAYGLLGVINYSKGLFDESKRWYLKGIELSQNFKDTRYYYQNLDGLAHVYEKKGDYKNAIKLFKELIKNSDNRILISDYYASIKKAYHQLNNHDSLNTASGLFPDENEATECPETQKRLANEYQKLGHHDKAISLYQNAIENAKKNKSNGVLISAYLGMGAALIKLGKTEEAKPFFSSSLQEAKDQGSFGVQIEIYEGLEEIAIQEKNYKEAHYLALQRYKIKDSVASLQKSKEINELEIKYNTLEKEKEINKQQSITKIVIISFIIILIPIIGLLVLYYQKHKTHNELNKKQEEINQEKISSLMKDQELKVIKASIDSQDRERKRIAQELHDSIGANLAAVKLQISGIITNTQQEKIKMMNLLLDETYQQVRNLSHNLIPKKFSKNRFCDVLDEYCNNIGAASNLSIAFRPFPRKKIDTLEANLQVETFKIIQELITNTIKHAKASSIEIQFNLIKNELNILFEDNGIGFNTQNIINGIGFENIKSRLQKISGSFFIDSRINRGTIITVEIPLVTNSELLNEDFFDKKIF